MSVHTQRSSRASMEVKPSIETFAKIKVIGVGGSGGAAVNRMVAARVRGVEFIVVNTDAQALHHNGAGKKIHIGQTVTRGLGAGMSPSVADIAREAGALTVGVVTKPFSFEGAQRRAIAERGLDELAGKVDTIIVIPNDRIFQVIDKKTTLLAAFETVDDVLRQGVQGISDNITVPGLINVDFADVRAIMRDAGTALMGIGRGTGESRAVDAAKMATDSPLLELSIDGARGILYTITAGPNMSINEVSEASRVITASADASAKIIFGAVIDENFKDEIRVTVIATGFGAGALKSAVRAQESAPGRTPAASYGTPAPQYQASQRSVFQERKAPPSPRDSGDKTKGGDDEDLEIPAFIRKKMM